MKKALKTIIKGLALTIVGTACVSSAMAYATLGGTYTTGDAVAGFTTGSGNELIVNLGSITSLTNGEQWNLSTLLGTGSGDAGFANLNSLDWGVIGIIGSSHSYTNYSTAVGTGTANAQDAGSLISLVQVNSSGVEVDAASSENSWYNNVQTSGSGDASAPYSYLGGIADVTTPTSGSFTFAQDTNTWFDGSTATTNYFAFNSSGILMFTNTVTASGPPVPKIVAVTRSGNTSTIYFTTASSYTYTLYYTNTLTGGANPWPASPTTITGNGFTNHLTDTTAVGIRFYRISAH